MSFIEITESQIVPTEKVSQPRDKKQGPSPVADTANSEVDDETKLLSWQMKRHERLFSILSSHSDIDHPICAECTSLLLAQFNARLASATRERDAYATFLKNLQEDSTAPSADDEVKAARELEELVCKEDAAMQELEELEEEKRKLEAEVIALEEESRQLDFEERDFWASRNAFDDNLHDLTRSLASLQQKYAHDQHQLERLQRTNVYNDTFCIGHDGYFGTINGLRLGRLPGQNVEWAEINAAWGQTLLLLATVAERLGFTFRGYRLRPLGSTSRIEKLEWPQQPPDASARPRSARDNLQATTTNPPASVTPLDLYSSGDIPLGRVFNHRRFDAGMVAFLECLAQVGGHLEKTPSLAIGTRSTPPKNNAGRQLPYAIHGDKIGDISIKLGAGFQQDENFTKACKYALTCCKYLLAYVSNLENSKSS